MTGDRLIGVVLCIGLVALSARGEDQERFRARLVGSAVGEHVAGVPSGGAPWVVGRSEVSIHADGEIEVEAKGLLIASGPAANTVGPVTMVMASLICGDVDAADTVSAALSTSGDFRIRDTITIPSPCIAPAVLVRVSATTGGPVTGGPFIAVNALTSGGEDKDGH